MAVEAPPVGLVPKAIRRQQRAAEIVAAMGRYVEAGQKIPREWIDELTEIFVD